MPYVQRNAEGEIVSLHREAGPAAAEFLPDGHPALRAFIGEPGAPADEGDGFTRLDADFVRVIEDVIDTLIARHVLSITDLPPEAQAKLCARKSFRDRAARTALSLFGELGREAADPGVPLP